MAKPRRDVKPKALHPLRIKNRDARCPRHNKKDWRPLVEKVWDAGWWIERGGSNYLKCYPPDGNRMILMESTPSSPYTLDALVARASDFALGAAAAANFADSSVEIDFVVAVATAAEVYERVAAVIRVLEEAGLTDAGSPPVPDRSERFALSSSSTQAVEQPLCVA
jgi:hypothetical protein